MFSANSIGAARVNEFMTQPVITIDRNAGCDEADASMERHGIRHLPVMEEGRLVGVLGRHDLMRSALAFALGFGERGRAMLLHTLRVKEVMRERMVTIGAGQPASEVARLLLDHRIGCLPVLEDGELVGIVTSSDLLRLLATSNCGLVATSGR
jgi:acetoin utilization protein AcuB